jgi:ABC-type phosphate/phosphonate transport system substrate-binding protein
MTAAMVRSSSLSALLVLIVLVLLVASAGAQEFKIGIMQDQKGAAENFAPLELYLKGFGIEIKLLEAASYAAATRMFAEGQVDGMFSGSGVAGSMIIKEVAYPLLRPVSKQGYSTYHAVVLARKGAPKFTATADYFRGKKVIYCALASSGEFFFRSISGANREAIILFTAASHGAAISALAEGRADIAIVKNWVWEGVKGQYPHLEQVGSDSGQNPDGTLIISKQADRQAVQKVLQALLALAKDQGAAAAAVRSTMDIDGYIPTTAMDFRHTLELLRRAGVKADFDAFQAAE